MEDCVRLDSATVQRLYTAYSNELRALLVGVLRDRELAQDVLQVAFGKVVELGHTAQEATLKGWLFQVAYREALLVRRRQTTEQRSLGKLIGCLRQEAESADRKSIAQDEQQRVRRALDELTKEQRIVVQMRIYEDKTFAVIASELSLPLGTVLSRMRAALERLRRDLQTCD